MTQYINKAAVIEEIERLEKENKQSEYVFDSLDTEYTLKSILSFINTLKVKEVEEVDLEKEIEDWYSTMGILVTFDALKETARHFFELGLKAQKELD